MVIGTPPTNKKSHTLFLILSLLVWKPITDSLSDAVRDSTRAIITQADNATFGDKNMRPKKGSRGGRGGA
ncbi:hypothetical protein D3C73_761890 [compost metagenome]